MPSDKHARNIRCENMPGTNGGKTSAKHDVWNMASTSCAPHKMCRAYHMSANFGSESNVVDYLQICIMLTYSNTIFRVCIEATTSGKNHTNLNNQMYQV